MKNAQNAVDKSKISAMQNEIKTAIAKKIISSNRSITIADIITQLEKQGIVTSGDSNIETGQVKTQPDGYIYEIKEKNNGDWEVTYVGNGDIETPEVIITLAKNTTGLTDKVLITMIAKADSGIASYILPEGTEQSVISGTREITKTYTATNNGTYEFTVTNRNGNSVSKSIVIDNILENTIQISANKTMPTIDDVIVTIKWPSDASKGVKQIQVGEGAWQTVTGATSQITVSQNCTVTAKVRNTIGEISSASLSIENIDKTNPSVTATAGTFTIDWQTNSEISNYFTVVANGTAGIAEIQYIDTSNGNVEVDNTNMLGVGTHIIKCTATKETGKTASATVTIVVVETKPTVIATTSSVTIYYGNSNAISGYFKVEQNGTCAITYIDTSAGNVEVDNTNTLEVGTHIIKCTATNAIGETASATVTIVVIELGVYGNVYKISDSEYHLVINASGIIADGYNNEQLVCRSANLTDGLLVR